jgi:hypothetical protein
VAPREKSISLNPKLLYCRSRSALPKAINASRPSQSCSFFRSTRTLSYHSARQDSWQHSQEFQVPEIDIGSDENPVVHERPHIELASGIANEALYKLAMHLDENVALVAKRTMETDSCRNEPAKAKIASWQRRAASNPDAFGSSVALRPTQMRLDTEH